MTSPARGSSAGPIWYVGGFMIAVALAIGSLWIIRSAWTCSDVEPGGGLALVFLYLPIALVLAFLGIAATLRLAQVIPLIGRLITGTVLATVLCHLLIVQIVPAYGEAGSADYIESKACRVDGVPTWWPAWLPH